MTHHETGKRDILIAVKTRDEVVRVLTGLEDARQQSEARLAEAGKLDPLKNLTGRSALDRAVETTQDILQDMDDLVKELRSETNQADPAQVGVTARATVNGVTSIPTGTVRQ